jgi:hypothetical protein
MTLGLLLLLKPPPLQPPPLADRRRSWAPANRRFKEFIMVCTRQSQRAHAKKITSACNLQEFTHRLFVKKAIAHAMKFAPHVSMEKKPTRY